MTSIKYNKFILYREVRDYAVELIETYTYISCINRLEAPKNIEVDIINQLWNH